MGPIRRPGHGQAVEATSSLGPAGRAREGESRPESPHTLCRLLCFSWQILITFYFDHTVECYVSELN